MITEVDNSVFNNVMKKKDESLSLRNNDAKITFVIPDVSEKVLEKISKKVNFFQLETITPEYCKLENDKYKGCEDDIDVSELTISFTDDDEFNVWNLFYTNLMKNPEIQVKLSIKQKSLTFDCRLNMIEPLKIDYKNLNDKIEFKLYLRVDSMKVN